MWRCSYLNMQHIKQSVGIVSPILSLHYFKNLRPDYLFLIYKENQKEMFNYFWTGSANINRWDSTQKTSLDTQHGHVHDPYLKVGSELLPMQFNHSYSARPVAMETRFSPLPVLSSCMQQQGLRGATKYIEEVVKTPHSINCWLWSSSVVAAGAGASRNLDRIYSQLTCNSWLPSLEYFIFILVARFAQCLH